MTLQDVGVIVTVLGSLGTVLATIVGAHRAGMRASLKEVTGERDTLAANTRTARVENDRAVNRLLKIVSACRRYIASLEGKLTQDELDELVRPAEVDWDLSDGN